MKSGENGVLCRLAMERSATSWASGDDRHDIFIILDRCSDGQQRATVLGSGGGMARGGRTAEG